MKKTILFLAFITASGLLFAQKKTTTSATVSFDATTAKDALPKAENKTVIASLDTKTGDVAFEAAVKNFSFSNPRMQEHFNGATWLNSDQFPKFTFTGKIEKMNKVKLTKDGVYKVTVNGDLTIKGTTKKTKVEGTITVAGDKINVTTDFSILLADYNISGQQPIEAGKVSKEPKISVSAEF
jgi:polyisoprenoid-binding protein YceI